MKRKNSPPGFPPARGLILVPVDFSETSLRALDAAVALAYGARSRLLLLHVVESYPMDRLLGDTLTAHATMPLLKEAEARLGTLAADLKKQSGVSVEAASRFGRPFDEITHAAKKLGADLIVLTTHGFTGLKHVYLGSVAERVVRHAPCPVLVVR